MPELNDWDITAANNNSAPPDGWPENTMQYSEVNDTAREGMAVMARYYKDINGSLQLGGVADAYTVTLNAGYTAYYQGMYFAAEVNITNTGATTLNVNGIGVQTVVDVSGAALGAGDLQAGGIYEFRYDGTNFQLVGGGGAGGDIDVGAVTTDDMRLRTDTNAPAGPAGQVGVGTYDIYDSDESDRLAQLGFIGGSNGDFRLRNDVHSGHVQITGSQSGGTEVFLFVGDPDAEASIYSQGTETFVAYNGNRVSVRADITTATPPTTETPTAYYELADSDGTDVLGRIGFEAVSTLRITNLMHGGLIQLRAEDSSGVNQILFSGAPDGTAQLYSSGLSVLRTQVSGVEIADTSGSDPVLGFYSDGFGARQARIEVPDTGAMTIRNEVHGGTIALEAENAVGTVAPLFAGDPDGVVTLYYAGLDRAATGDGVFAVRRDDDVDTSLLSIQLQHNDATIRGRVGYTGSGDLRLRNQVHGGDILLEAEDTVGTVRIVVQGDPDGDTIIRGDTDVELQNSAGTLVCKTFPERWDIFANDSIASSSCFLYFREQGGANRGYLGYNGSQILNLRNLHNGQQVEINANDAGGILRTLFNGDPDGLTQIRGDTDVELQLGPTPEIALHADINGAVLLYYDNVEVFRTADEDANDIGTGAEIRHADNSFYPVGLNVVPEDSSIDGGTVALTVDNASKMIHYNSATARTLQLNNTAALPVGAMWSLIVGPSAGTLTLDGGTGVQIRWWNGTGWTTTAAAGNITAGVGQYTIWKETDTLYHVSGPTLS